MSFTRPSDQHKDQVYGSIRDPENLSPFGCLDCLLKDAIEAQAYPLYLFQGTNLCANHVRLRLEDEKGLIREGARAVDIINMSMEAAYRDTLATKAAHIRTDNPLKDNNA